MRNVHHNAIWSGSCGIFLCAAILSCASSLKAEGLRVTIDESRALISYAGVVPAGTSRLELLRQSGSLWEVIDEVSPDPWTRAGNLTFRALGRKTKGTAYRYRVVDIDVRGNRHVMVEEEKFFDLTVDQAEVTTTKAVVAAVNDRSLRAAGTVSHPYFLDLPYVTSTPIQTGTTRKCAVMTSGFYRVPAGMSRVFNVGKELPIMDFAGERAVFARAISDFYTDENMLFSGELAIAGSAGSLPAPATQAVLNADGSVTGVFYLGEDAIYDANTYIGRAPNWYLEGLVGDVNTTTHDVSLSGVLGTGLSHISVGVNVWSVDGDTNTMTIYINDIQVMAATSWTWTGYAVAEASFDAETAQLTTGSNQVELVFDFGTHKVTKELDYIEIQTPVTPELRDGSLVVETASDVSNGQVMITGATYAADISTFGEELALSPTNGLVTGLSGGQILFFANTVGDLTWSDELTLAEPVGVSSADYVAVAASTDYVLPLSSLIDKHNASDHSALTVLFETVQDVYGGGLFGPQGIMTMVNAHAPDYLLLAGTTNHDYKVIRASTQNWLFPWIPSGWHQVQEWTPTDDVFSRGYRTQVGRIPINDATELSNWVAKAVAYDAGDVVTLMAGTNDPDLNFQTAQRENLDTIPSLLIAPENKAKLQTAVNDLNAGTVLYQGHGNWEYLNQKDNQMLASGWAANYAPSCWVMGTCNAGLYHRPADAVGEDNNDEDTDKYLCLAYVFLKTANAGGVDIVACPTVAVAEELDTLTQTMIAYMQTDPDLTWGKLVQKLKTALRYYTTVQLYTLFGDPLCPVQSRSLRDTSLVSPEAGGFLDLSAGRAEARVAINFSGTWPGTSAVVIDFRIDEGLWREANLVEAAVPVSNGQVELKWDTSGLNLSDSMSVELRTRTVENALSVYWGISEPFTLDLTSPTVAIESILYGDSTVRVTASAADALSGPSGLYRYQIHEANSRTTLVDSGWIETAEFTWVPGSDPDGDWIVEVSARDVAGNVASVEETLLYSSGDADQDGRTNQEELDAGTDPFAVDLHILPGWNALALPYAVGEEVWNDVLAASDGSMWSWSGTRYEYLDEEPSPCVGFWLHSDHEVWLSCQQGSRPAFPTALSRGWTLLGVGQYSRVVEAPSSYALWEYTQGTLTVLETGPTGTARLVPGRAYWFFSASDGPLLIEEVEN